ncbi:uncharacterized protein LOC144936069 [Lampetra fluviatilis]
MQRHYLQGSRPRPHLPAYLSGYRVQDPVERAHLTAHLEQLCRPRPNLPPAIAQVEVFDPTQLRHVRPVTKGQLPTSREIEEEKRAYAISYPEKVTWPATSAQEALEFGSAQAGGWPWGFSRRPTLQSNGALHLT